MFHQNVNHRRGRQFLWRARNAEQLQAGFVRQAVAFARVHVLAGPNQVLPGVLAAARTGHDVIQAAFVQAQHAAGVLPVPKAFGIALAEDRRRTNEGWSDDRLLSLLAGVRSCSLGCSNGTMRRTPNTAWAWVIFTAASWRSRPVAWAKRGRRFRPGSRLGKQEERASGFDIN